MAKLLGDGGLVPVVKYMTGPSTAREMHMIFYQFTQPEPIESIHIVHEIDKAMACKVIATTARTLWQAVPSLT